MRQPAELVTEGVEFPLNLRSVLHLQSQCLIDVFDSSLQDEDFFVFGASECARRAMNSGLSSRSHCARLASLAPDSWVAPWPCLTDPVVSGFARWSSSSLKATLTARTRVGHN